jgi:hypothetical protein
MRIFYRLTWLQAFVDLEEVGELAAVEFSDPIHVLDSCTWDPGWGAQDPLLSFTSSSDMQNIPIARVRICRPGKVGAPTSTSASRGSSTRPSEPSMYPSRPDT